MNYYLAKQLACPAPSVFDGRAVWKVEITLGDWLRPHVLEMSYTSWRLKPYAEDLGDDGAPFHWDPGRRALLWADLDAGFLHAQDNFGVAVPAKSLLDHRVGVADFGVEGWATIAAASCCPGEPEMDSSVSPRTSRRRTRGEPNK
jgi:hypothetical protein